MWYLAGMYFFHSIILARWWETRGDSWLAVKCGHRSDAAARQIKPSDVAVCDGILMSWSMLVSILSCPPSTMPETAADHDIIHDGINYVNIWRAQYSTTCNKCFVWYNRMVAKKHTSRRHTFQGLVISFGKSQLVVCDLYLSWINVLTLIPQLSFYAYTNVQYISHMHIFHWNFSILMYNTEHFLRNVGSMRPGFESGSSLYFL